MSRTAAGGGVGLLERGPETALLAAGIGSARQGRGGVAVIEADAGVGKTRLLAEAQRMAANSGLQVLSGRGIELERGIGFGVLRQLYEPVLAASDPATRERLLDGGAEQAAAVLAPDADSAQLAGEIATMHALYWLTVNLCQQRPLAIVVDDLHWADYASLTFLAYLLPRLDGLPVVIVASTRPNEPHAHQHLIDLLTVDSSTDVLRPGPLSRQGCAEAVRALLGAGTEEAFCAACHRLTGGNPLLLNELVTVAAAEGIAGTAAQAQRLETVAAGTIERRIGRQLAALPPEATALVQAAAVLDDNARPLDAATVAGLTGRQAIAAQSALATAGILAAGELLSFVHPLVRAAVYRGIEAPARAQLHRRAATALSAGAGAVQQVAEHLVRTEPRNDPDVVEALRLGATQALTHAAPHSALTYLERAIEELPPGAAARSELLAWTGAVAQLVDWGKAVQYLTLAQQAATTPEAGARVANILGGALMIVGRPRESVRIYQDAIAALGTGMDDLRRQLQARMISVTTTGDAALHHIADSIVAELREDEFGAGLGARMLDAVVGWHDAMVSLSLDTATQRAELALSTGQLLTEPSTPLPFGQACWVLTAADSEDAPTIYDTALDWAHRNGTMSSVALISILRSLCRLCRGSLPEAEADAREATRLVDATRGSLGRPFAGGYLADALIEQGKLTAAADALDWAYRAGPLPSSGHVAWLEASEARLMVRRGDTKEGADRLVACGRRCAERGWRNPAFIDWHADAALALHSLGRLAEARELNAEHVEHARRWGAPRALGQALRVAGTIDESHSGALASLTEAVDVLRPSPARLEFAKALLALGSTLRRRGQRVEARLHLSQALDTADRCGAVPVATQTVAELRAAGGRPRRTALSGPEALTPTESRVATMAATGVTNREIAQAMFVTPKTVEVHLSNVYRKLDVRTRAEMAKIIGRPTDAVPAGG